MSPRRIIRLRGARRSRLRSDRCFQEETRGDALPAVARYHREVPFAPAIATAVAGLATRTSRRPLARSFSHGPGDHSTSAGTVAPTHTAAPKAIPCHGGHPRLAIHGLGRCRFHGSYWGRPTSRAEPWLATFGKTSTPSGISVPRYKFTCLVDLNRRKRNIEQLRHFFSDLTLINPTPELLHDPVRRDDDG